MSTEQSEPTPHYGDDGHHTGNDAVAAQTGDGGSREQGAGSATRRRRRRRKNKGGSPAASPAAVDDGAGAGKDGSGVAPIPMAAAPVISQAPAQGQREPGSHGSGKRKNGRKRGSGGPPAPGSAQNNGSQGSSTPPPYRDKRARDGRQSNGGGAPAGQNNHGGSWRSRSSDGPDGNREGARGGFGSTEHFGDANGNSNGRKGKFGRRGPTSFVGPMDHSYRVVNGNIADGPPSTMDYRQSNGNANGNIGSRSDFGESGAAAAALRESAPTRIICFIEDLFVVAKMQETARKLGVKVQFAKAEKETLASITDAPEAERPSLIVFDLNNGKPLAAIPKLKAKLKRGTSIIGFLQQIQGDLKLKAIEAGCDSVMPKAAFSQNLPNLLRRHGLAEEEEMVEA